jgi:hypothetical protein
MFNIIYIKLQIDINNKKILKIKWEHDKEKKKKKERTSLVVHNNVKPKLHIVKDVVVIFREAFSIHPFVPSSIHVWYISLVVIFIAILFFSSFLMKPGWRASLRQISTELANFFKETPKTIASRHKCGDTIGGVVNILVRNILC